MAKKWMYPMRKRGPKGRRAKRVAQKTKYTIAKMLGYGGFHCFKEKVSGVLTITGSPESPNSQIVQNISIRGANYSSWRFNLNQISDIGNYQRLFQQARMTGCQIKFFPSHNMSSYLTNSTITDAAGAPAGTSVSTVRPIPTLVYKFDPNDVVAPTSFNNLLEKDPRFIYLNRPKKLYVKPKLLTVNQEGSIVADTIFTNTNAVKWINLNKLVPVPAGGTPVDTTYDYCGLDMGSMNCQGSVQVPFVLTYYFQCKTQT